MKIKRDVNIHEFPNGFRVIHQKPSNPLAVTSIYAFTNVGSAFESDGIRGVSHFVEHMCFKGTDKIPDPRNIFLAYDRIGAYFNAFTEKRLTCFTVKCEDLYVHHCTDILADMMLNSNFPKKKFYKEQAVVVEENIRNQNNINIMLGEKVDAILYGGSSYAYPIDTLSYHPKSDSLKYEDVVKWYECYYKPSNFVYSIVSNLSFKAVIKLLESSIFVKTVEKPCVSRHNLDLSLQQYTAPQIYLEKKKGVSTNAIYIGFRTCSKDSSDRYVLKVLKHVLNGMSGRLFTILREDNGLTYISKCNTEHVEHTGYFLVYVETDPNKTNRVLSLLIEMFQRLNTHGITAEELSVAKGNIRGKRTIGMENNDKIADYNGRELLLNTEFQKYEDIYSHHIAKISKDDVFKAIQKYFIPGNMVLGIMGETVPAKKSLEKMLL